MDKEQQHLEEEKVGVETEDTASDEVPDYLRSAAKRGVLGTLRGYEEKLDRLLGVESHAIARKRPEDRDPNFKLWSNQAVCNAPVPRCCWLATLVVDLRVDNR